MKHIYRIFLLSVLCALCTSCRKKATDGLSTLDIKHICDMAVLECYYHNNAEAIIPKTWTSKEKKQWIDYSSKVKIGIDASQLQIHIEEDTVTITLPKAKVLGEPKIDTDSIDMFTESGGKFTNEDQVKAMQEANKNAKETTRNNTQLLANAENRIKKIIESYIQQIGELTDRNYTIVWVPYEEVEEK